MVGLVDRLNALLCARHSVSLAAQLAALDSRCCAPSAGGTAPLVFLPTSALGPARRGLFMQSAHAKANRRREDVIAHSWMSRTA